MAEIQITPAGFLPAATEQQAQVNPGAVNGGIGTLNQRGDNVVQNIEDVIDLNADEGGTGNGGGATDREAALQTANDDIAVRIDYDIDERQLYIEFVDTRTDTTITSVPRRDAFSVDALALRNDGFTEAPNTAAVAVQNNEVARNDAEIEVVARQAVVDNRLPAPPVRAEAPVETPAEIIEEAVPQQVADRQPAQNASREQIAIIEGL